MLVGSLLVAACSSLPSAVKPRTSTSTSKTGGTNDTTGQPSDNTQPTTTPDNPGTQSYFGIVLDESGKPVAGVPIVGYLISNNGGGVVSNNGSGLISNNGGGLVSDKGTSYKVLDTGMTATTDAQGHFTLSDPQGRSINIEADQSGTEKAIAFNVASDAAGVQLKLAPTGAIAGKVTASKDPTVKHFIGVQVFVPGTGYEAATADDGSFTISGVPKGTYALYATKDGLGNATIGDVKVASNQTASATLDLSVAAPTIASVTPAVAGIGATVTLKGANFGATDGAIFSVTCGGATVSNPTRSDDNTITFTVPGGASSNDVLVTVNGIQSTAATLDIISKITITAPMKVMLVGQTVQATVKAQDQSKKTIAVTPNEISWTSSAPSIMSVDANGLIKALGQGQATITASGSNALKFTSYATGPLLTTDSVLDDSDVSDIGGVAYDSKGQIYVTDDESYIIERIDASGTAKAIYDDENDSTFYWGLGGLVVDGTGNTYACDVTNNRVVEIAADGTYSVLAGPTNAMAGDSGNCPSGLTDGQGTAVRFDAPQDVARDASGNLYVADSKNNCLRKITPDGTTTTFVSGLADPVGLGSDAQGNLYVACAGDNTIRK
ncbi:MAG TPA: carboxypeptidase regulatory-like domain-containing protein, partial [Oscillatoriaceae cyanobacterium]